ncbi:HNH endonuclease [Alcanivorax sediminis]|uniref:HNH endonuclease n=1 Tax=Alcanivorax sediminis TaxID=2663008 RepID=A0A6N7LTY6_9GAMM|nr:HNH endonuclease signature motif containing protein [Alcanivorax sediminis]MQX51871.1 HNH endonuclease [Alcanivorax sediminis]
MSKNWEHAAGILWPVLTEAAQKGQTLTYSDLAPLIDTNPLSVGKGLGPILYHCLNNKIPPLTVIVIGKISGVPGAGFIAWDIDDLDEAYKQVFAFNWATVDNPFAGYGEENTTESFAQYLVENPAKSGEIYSRVKVRGSAQRIFRRALLEAYEYQCAMCRLSFEEVLEAAHIVPWAECEHSQRISPSNGILLCANHHKLFDCGYISVSPSLVIEYEDDEFSQEDYSESDISASMSLNGKQLHLPKNVELHPCPELLKKRSTE